MALLMTTTADDAGDDGECDYTLFRLQGRNTLHLCAKTLSSGKDRDRRPDMHQVIDQDLHFEYKLFAMQVATVLMRNDGGNTRASMR